MAAVIEQVQHFKDTKYDIDSRGIYEIGYGMLSLTEFFSFEETMSQSLRMFIPNANRKNIIL